MEFQSYNAELGIANLLFKRIFQNIRIGRTNDKGEETQLLVQCVLGNRSRIMKGLENPERRGNYKLPMIVIQRTGYSRNGERLNNFNNEVKYELASYCRKYHLMAPVPIDINYDVTVIAKYPQDIDKIASNFMVFFNSDIYVSCEHPKYAGIKMNNQVIMDDSVNEEHPDEFDGSQDDITSSTFSFTFKTYLFGGTRRANLIPSQIVSSYISTIVSSQIIELKPDEIDQFQQDYPDKCVSASLTTLVTSTLTSYVDNPDSGEDVYDDLPIINRIDFGLYAVPNNKEIVPYIQSVDNGDYGPHEHVNVSGYISSLSYEAPPMTMLSDPYVYTDQSASQYGVMDRPLSTIGDYYEDVDLCCSLEPYVDKMYWTIDGVSEYSFPNNVSWHRD